MPFTSTKEFFPLEILHQKAKISKRMRKDEVRVYTHRNIKSAKGQPGTLTEILIKFVQ